MIVQKNITVIDTGHIDSSYYAALLKFLSVNGYKHSCFSVDRSMQRGTRGILGIEEGSVDDLVEWLGKIGIVEKPPKLPRKTR